jgi:pimeloyl-ACP methyl ester carboxylesterase
MSLSDKSTNDRSGESGDALAWLQPLLKASERLSPRLAARALQPIFLTPRRHARPQREQAVLQKAQRSSMRISGAQIPMYSWGAGPTVLFSHGWEGRGTQVESFVEPLLARGFRVLSFDQPGHGDAAAARMSVLDFARVISELVLRLGPVHGAIGHSVGGTALAFARAQRPFARSFVTIASPLHPRDFAASFTASLGLSRDTAQALEARIAARHGLTREQLDLSHALGSIDAPALIVHDRSDREVPFTHAEGFVRHWPGARLLATEGLGHRRILRDARVVDAAVAALERRATSNERELDVQLERELFAPSARLGLG